EHVLRPRGVPGPRRRHEQGLRGARPVELLTNGTNPSRLRNGAGLTSPPERSREGTVEARENAAGGDREVRRLVEANMPFVFRVARQYQNVGIPLEDLRNEGIVGLIEAARRYDPERGTKFSTYAVWWI